MSSLTFNQPPEIVGAEEFKTVAECHAFIDKLVIPFGRKKIKASMKKKCQEAFDKKKALEIAKVEAPTEPDILNNDVDEEPEKMNLVLPLAIAGGVLALVIALKN